MWCRNFCSLSVASSLPLLTFVEKWKLTGEEMGTQWGLKVHNHSVQFTRTLFGHASWNTESISTRKLTVSAFTVSPNLVSLACNYYFFSSSLLPLMVLVTVTLALICVLLFICVCSVGIDYHLLLIVVFNIYNYWLQFASQSATRGH